MASIYKPTYIDPKTGKRKKAQTWRISYIDAAGRRRSVGGFKDKEATLAKARELERNAERERAGLPVENNKRKHQPIEELIVLYLSELRRLGRTSVHMREQLRMLTTLKKKLPVETIAAFRIDKLTSYLSTLQSQGRSPRTLNAYRDAMHSFFAFCTRQGWMEKNPLEGHPRARSGGKKSKPRRAYTAAEFASLLQAAPARRTIYMTAGLSGLRKSELRRLEKRDLSPTGDRPRWHLRAEITKAKRREEVPIVPDLLPTIRTLWETIESPVGRLFPRMPRTATINKDLERAGIPKLDEEARAVDFHSLRYFFCTLLARHLPIQQVRLLMRHRDIRQTCNLYMDLGLTDVQEAIERLPPLFQQGEPQAAKTTPPEQPAAHASFASHQTAPEAIPA